MLRLITILRTSEENPFQSTYIILNWLISLTPKAFLQASRTLASQFVALQRLVIVCMFCELAERVTACRAFGGPQEGHGEDGRMKCSDSQANLMNLGYMENQEEK